MHILKDIGWTLLGIWGYVFIGVHVMRPFLAERRGMDDPAVITIGIALWPIMPITDAFGIE